MIESASWKQKAFRFLSAQTISLFGSSLVQYAIVWYITLSTSSGAMLTISTICGFLPQILVALFAGVWIDRYNRKTVIMLADGIIALSTLVLAVAFLSGYRELWLLFAVLAIRSAGTGIQTPAVNSLLPQLVPPEHLMRVNGINSTLSSLMMFLSPAVSGAILSFASLEATLFIDVITAVIGIGITSTILVPRLAAIARESGAREFQKGFLFLKKSPFVRRLLLFQITILFFISPSAFLTPLMVARTFGPEVWRLTASEMTYSLGMVLGGMLIAAWGGFSKRLNTTLLAGTLYGCIMLGLGFAPFFPVYLVFNLLIGVTSPCYNAPITVSIQENIEPAMHGRVFSLMQISTSCALPLGILLFGPLADVIPVQIILIGAGLLVLAASILMWRSKWLESGLQK